MLWWYYIWIKQKQGAHQTDIGLEAIDRYEIPDWTDQSDKSLLCYWPYVRGSLDGLKSSFQMTVESNYVIGIATLSDWYGGPQVSRQMFDVNNAKLEKNTSTLIFYLLLKF